MDFCNRSELFGKVGQNLHSYRVLDIAVIDVVATIVAGILIVNFLPKHILSRLPDGNMGLIVVIAVLFGLGIASHRVFCVKTTVDKLIFGDK